MKAFPAEEDHPVSSSPRLSLQPLLCGAVIAEMEYGRANHLKLEIVERRGLHLLNEIEMPDADRDMRVVVLAIAI
jgi:hypothetical protein